MSLDLPSCDTLCLERQGATLYVTLSRPEVRNALSRAMATELEAVADLVREHREVRTLVLRGAGGTFCAGADIKEMAGARAAPLDPGGVDAIADINRLFGRMISKIDRAPQAVVAVVEGVVMGGGLGLVCVADVAIARADVRFKLPETSLGIPPAQIAPFLVRRLGLSQTRRLAVTGGELDGRQAAEIGLVHTICDDAEALEAELERTLDLIDRCAPGAIAVTKELVQEALLSPPEALVDRCAAAFAAQARGPEGAEGMAAFIAKRAPAWSVRQRLKERGE